MDTLGNVLTAPDSFMRRIREIRDRPPPTEEEMRAAEEQRRAREAEEREREIRQLIAPLARDLGARYGPGRARLENFEQYHPAQAELLGRLRAILATWPKALQQGEGLIFMGPVGVGKDFLLAVSLYAAARHGLTARWFSAQDLFARLRDAMDTHIGEAELLRDYERADVLGISDPVPAVGELSPWNVSQLTRLVDRRYRQLRPTLLTVNAADENDAALRLSAPLYDRLRHGAEVLVCRWPSYRRRQKPAPPPPPAKTPNG
jgi:DNA replication protein DnaC